MLSAVRFTRLLAQSSTRCVYTTAHANVLFPTSTPHVSVPSTMKTLPEGMCGDMEEEFTITSNRSWMIRDISRVMCRVIDDYPAQNKNMPSDSIIAPINPANAWINMWHRDAYPGYSDRPEWRSSIINAKLHGTDILPCPAKELGTLKDRPFIDKVLKTWSRTGDTGTGDTSTGNNKKNILPESTEVAFSKALDTAIKHSASQNGGKYAHNYPDKILLRGDRGVGKSAVLNQMVMHARASGWLCLFIPDAWDHVQSGWYISPVKQSSSANGGKGQLTPFLYDNPFQSARALRHFHQAHNEILSTIPIKLTDNMKKYEPVLAAFKDEWNRAKAMKGRENLSFRQMRRIILDEDHFEEQDELDAPILDNIDLFDYASYRHNTLLDLVHMGIAFRDSAGLVFLDLIEELKIHTDHPVMIAVDQYNTWHAPSAYNWENRQVQGNEMCVTHALQFICKKKSETENWRLKNGLCVAAVTSKYPEGLHKQYKDVTNSIPLTVKIPSYNQHEFISVISHYKTKNLINCDVTQTELQSFRMQTGSIGREIRREVLPTFFPLSVEKGGDDYMAAAVAENIHSSGSGVESGSGNWNGDQDEPLRYSGRKPHRSGGSGEDSAGGLIDRLVQ